MIDFIRPIALLFAIEGNGDFKVIKIDPPFLHSNYGCFDVCLGEIVNGKEVEITPLAVSNHDDIDVDFRVIVFVDKKRMNDSSGNTVIVKNDDTFKLKWDSAQAFAKTISRKFWLDIEKYEQ